MNRPVVRSVGVPPERHAARVVAEMCRWLNDEQRHLWGSLLGATQPGNSWGNPINQRRFTERVVKAAGKSLLDHSLITGKRGVFELDLVMWQVLHPQSEKPWLACLMHTILGKPRKVEHRSPFHVTHHAMQRLVECGEVRDPDELVQAVKTLWRSIMMEIAEGDNRLAVAIPVAGGNAICTREARGRLFLVKTVLRPGMILPPELRKVAA